MVFSGYKRGIAFAVLSIIAALVAACSGAATPAAPAVTTAPATMAPATMAPATMAPATMAPATMAPATMAPAATAPAATVQPATGPTTAPTETGAGGASLDGTFEGTIKVAGQELATRFNFKGSGGTVDFPTQGAVGLPMQNFAVQGSTVSFEVLPAPQTASFSGEAQGDEFSGSFKQSGYEGTFATKRAAAAQPLDYGGEEVTFKNGDVTLAGTLTLPEGTGPHPAVVLISGSGAQNRDEEIFGFKPFAILADELSKAGIAVLRYDDRGIGGSTPGTSADTSETYAGDVRAAIEYLRTRKEIDGAKIGLIGHSEGGIIAPMVSVETGKPAFLVLLAGSSIPGDDLLVEQAVEVGKSSGASDADAEKTRKEQRAIVDAVVSGQGLDELRADLIKRYRDAADKLPAQQKQALGDLDKWAETTVNSQFAMLESPWMKFFLTHDPAATLEKVTVPVLALFGEKDVQVPPSVNVEPMKAALEKAGNKDVTLTVIPGANHLFQAAKTGSPNEYATLPKEFAPGVIDTLVTWLTERVK